MAIGIDVHELPPKHWEALCIAMDTLEIDCRQDLADLRDGAEVAWVGMAGYLPAKYLPRYTISFAERFLACMLTVGLKLRAPDFHSLDCVAEELALNALIEEAERILGLDGTESDFDLFRDTAFEDLDFELLFNAELDGIEDTQIGEHHGMANLHFDEWFAPFRVDGLVPPTDVQELSDDK